MSRGESAPRQSDRHSGIGWGARLAILVGVLACPAVAMATPDVPPAGPDSTTEIELVETDPADASSTDAPATDAVALTADAAGADRSATSTDGSSSAQNSAGADAASVTQSASRPPRMHVHDLGLGYHALLLRTERSDQYTLHGPSVIYDYFYGRRWGLMVRVAAHFPVAGTMHGPSGDFSGTLNGEYDGDRYGIDGMLMIARRKPLSPTLAITTAFGPHIQWFSLTGRKYSPVQDASFGLGGVGKLERSLNRWLSVTGQLALGVDLIDLSDHQNPATLVVPFSLAIALTAHH